MNEEQEVIVNNESNGNNPYLKDGYGIWPRLKFLKEENEFLSDQEVYDGDIHKTTSISFDPETLTEVEAGSVIQVELVPEPNIANVPVCVWETSDETVARVNGQGKIFFYKSGEVTITATDVTDSGVNTSFEFTVVEPGVKPEPEPEDPRVITNYRIVYENWPENGVLSFTFSGIRDYVNSIEVNGEEIENNSGYGEYNLGPQPENPDPTVPDDRYLDLTVKYEFTDSTSIPSEYFEHNNYITEIMLPSNVTVIGDGALYEMYNLEKLTIKSPVPPESSGSLDYWSGTLYVPAESVDAYRESEVWGDYNIVAI